jgi:hypothetical protein
VRRLISRAVAQALCVTVALGAVAAPCAAEVAAKASRNLTRLSPASRQLLAAAPTAAAKQQQPAGTQSTSTSFFKSTRGKVTLALMGAGVGFTIWSVNHDRKPVRSPIR